ncbi:DUF6020 family protein [Leuconostocaceae bacterium ESL0723]|nr:DUF6020 family protein [Leuconostocaceae bacterium ESL0723]
MQLTQKIIAGLKQYWPTSLAAIILSIFFTWATLIQPSGYYDFRFSGGRLYFLAVLFFLGYVWLIMMVEQQALSFFRSSLVRSKVFAPVSANWLYFRVPVILILAWLPYVLVTWPGVLSWDGADQLNAYFQVAMPPQDIHFYGIDYNGTQQQFYLTNHHPWFTSLVLGSAFKIGQQWFGGLAGGLATIVVLNTTLLVTALSRLAIQIFRYAKLWGWLTLLLFALLPTFPIMAVNVNKTALAVAVFAFFVSALLRLWQQPQKWQRWLALLIISILLGLVRNDSFVMIGAAMVFGLFYRRVRKPLLTIGIVTLLALSVWNRVVLPAAQVLPSEKVEMLAVTNQQLARVVVKDPNGLTADQHQELSKFTDVNALKAAYNPTFYDPVKHTFYYYPVNFWQRGKTYQQNQAALKNGYLNQHFSDYLKLWLAVGSKNLGQYTAALMNDAYQYFTFIHNPVQTDLFLGGGVVPYENTTLFTGYRQNHPRAINQGQSWLNHLNQFPGIKLIFQTGLWGALTLMLLAMAIELRARLAVGLGMIGVGVLAVAAISPVNGLSRYIYPLYFLLPLMLAYMTWQQARRT